MNIFDIIALVIFFLTFINCAARGFLKIIARFGALFVAFIVSRWFGGTLGTQLLGDVLGGFASVIGVIVTFILLFFLCRIIFGLVAKMITKALGSGLIDKILGGAVGVIGGFAGIYLLGLVAQIIILVVSMVNSEATIITTIGESQILKHFII